MTVPAVFTTLGAKLLTVNPTPATALTRMLTNLSNRFGPGDCPVGLIRFAADTDNEVSSETLGQPGLVRHKYSLRVLIFLGVLTGPDMLDQDHELAKPWPQALAVTLAADMTLGNTVAFIGDDVTLKLFTYRIGVMPWLGDVNYFGLTVTLPVTEKISTNVG